MHLLPNISKNKGNETMKIDHLIECKMRNIALQKPDTKFGTETSPRRFSDTLRLSVSLNQLSKIAYYLFLLYAKWSAIKIF